ncbi:MAG TPA: 16S rRNA (cytosine(1402)-N(4))-methyltransferase RsmH, partial [Burkholderiaceae bacterium]
MDTPGLHTTVLLHEAIDALVTRPEGTYVDGTFGRGGHTRALLARLGPGARVIAVDRDPEAIAAATTGPDAIADPRFEVVHASFAQLPQALAERGVERIDGLLLDLGVSSPQIDTPERGFSFRFDGPLDMRMDTTRGETAADFLARADERHIAEVIRDYGEERFAVSIAKAIVAGRQAGAPVRTTRELSALVARAVKTREPGQDPATRTFQALRILVNAELEELEQVLKSALDLLAPGGRLAVISFHSLEDRIVKTFIARESKAEIDRRAPFAPPQVALRLRALGR